MGEHGYKAANWAAYGACSSWWWFDLLGYCEQQQTFWFHNRKVGRSSGIHIKSTQTQHSGLLHSRIFSCGRSMTISDSPFAKLLRFQEEIWLPLADLLQKLLILFRNLQTLCLVCQPVAKTVFLLLLHFFPLDPLTCCAYVCHNLLKNQTSNFFSDSLLTVSFILLIILMVLCRRTCKVALPSEVKQLCTYLSQQFLSSWHGPLHTIGTVFSIKKPIDMHVIHRHGAQGASFGISVLTVGFLLSSSSLELKAHICLHQADRTLLILVEGKPLALLYFHTMPSMLELILAVFRGT